MVISLYCQLTNGVTHKKKKKKTQLILYIDDQKIYGSNHVILYINKQIFKVIEKDGVIFNSLTKNQSSKLEVFFSIKFLIIFII